MITKSERKKLKKILGNFYTTKVIAVLEELNITDSNGKTHSSNMIIQVFNGLTAHKEVEEAIIEAALRQKKELKKQKSNRKKLGIVN